MSHLLCVVIGCSPLMSHLLCVVIGCSPLMSHSLCVVIGCSPLMSHSLCVVIGCSPLMSHIHVHALHKLRIKPELTEKVDDQLHGTNKARLEWFGFVNSKLIL